MDITALVFLSGGLFLGWSLGANDAANVFGTAVGTRMVRFTTAAIICSVMVILGAVVSGGGAAATLGKLGVINAMPGAFAAASSAGVAVFLMTRWGLPVSTSQAIVGAIIGWNVYTGSDTDFATFSTIVSTWIFCPILAGAIAALLLPLVSKTVNIIQPHLLRLDFWTRVALVVAGAFGAYSLGANNIANVMGVFSQVSPLDGVSLPWGGALSPLQTLFLLGGLAIAVGIFTYSRRVMMTVGDGLLSLSPLSAWVVVIAHSVVLFLFASEGLSHWLESMGLPRIPLVPVSSSQAVIGAVIGIGLLKGGGGIRWSRLVTIVGGWVASPVAAGLITLFVLAVFEHLLGIPVVGQALV